MHLYVKGLNATNDNTDLIINRAFIKYIVPSNNSMQVHILLSLTHSYVQTSLLLE